VNVIAASGSAPPDGTITENVKMTKIAKKARFVEPPSDDEDEAPPNHNKPNSTIFGQPLPPTSRPSNDQYNSQPSSTQRKSNAPPINGFDSTKYQGVTLHWM